MMHREDRKAHEELCATMELQQLEDRLSVRLKHQDTVAFMRLSWKEHMKKADERRWFWSRFWDGVVGVMFVFFIVGVLTMGSWLLPVLALFGWK